MTCLQLIGVIGAFIIFVLVTWWCINHDCSNNSQWKKAMEKMKEEKFPYMWKETRPTMDTFVMRKTNRTIGAEFAFTLKWIDAINRLDGEVRLENAKIFLRPMSSMTEEEQKEFVKFHCVNICPIVITEELTISNEAKMFDWLNAHHFDYRGLIEKGLALEAPEGMYK